MSEDRHNEDMEKILHAFFDHEQKDIASQAEILKELKEMREEMKPILEIYKNANGAYLFATWFFKFLAVIAAGIGAYVFIKKFL